MINWPSRLATRSLPERPEASDYRESWRGDSVSFTPDVGAPIKRMRSTREYRRVEMSFLLDMTELSTLRGFYYNKGDDTTVPGIRQGIDSFKFPDPTEEATLPEAQWKTARWVGGAPNAVAEGPMTFRVSVRLEIYD